MIERVLATHHYHNTYNYLFRNKLPTMPTRFILLMFVFLFCCFSCNNAKPTESTTTEERVIDEEELLLRLSLELFTNPSSQEQQEHNQLISLAIDSLWDIFQTDSGLWYQIIKDGEGQNIQWKDRIEVHYEGFFLDGQKFDSSLDRGRPLKFYVGNMIPGWNEGMELAKVGSKMRLLVPSWLAYGKKGFVVPPKDTMVPPDSPIWFNLEVLRKIR